MGITGKEEMEDAELVQFIVASCYELIQDHINHTEINNEPTKQEALRAPPTPPLYSDLGELRDRLGQYRHGIFYDWLSEKFGIFNKRILYFRTTNTQHSIG